MPSELEKKTDYSIADGRKRKTLQCVYFAERFGRNVFAPIEKDEISKPLVYLLKYIEKTEERIVYSQGMAQYFFSDIMEEDVVCRCGIGESKLLNDDFACYGQGEVKEGHASPEVIAEMRKKKRVRAAQ